MPRCIAHLWVRQHGVDFGTDKQDVHTGIEPKHAKDNGSKASVSIRIVAHMVDIIRKQVRETKPSPC